MFFAYIYLNIILYSLIKIYGCIPINFYIKLINLKDIIYIYIEKFYT